MNTTKKVFFAVSLLIERIKYTVWPARRIHLIGDSLMAPQPWYKYPRTGWGNELQAYLNTDKVKVINHARNGGSTMSFDELGHFKKALKTVKKNDIVVLGFAHNDRYHVPANGNSPLALFNTLITRFIAQIKEKNAAVILCTPINLYNFGDDHGDFPEAIKLLSQSLSTGFLDLYSYSKDVQLSLGKEKAKELYLITQPGRFIMHPNGINDFIHLSPYGAQVFAKYASETLNIKLLLP